MDGALKLSMKAVKKEKWEKGLMVKGRNEPVTIVHVAHVIAKIKNVSVEELCEAWVPLHPLLTLLIADAAKCMEKFYSNVRSRELSELNNCHGSQSRSHCYIDNQNLQLNQPRVAGISFPRVPKEEGSKMEISRSSHCYPGRHEESPPHSSRGRSDKSRIETVLKRNKSG